jgi:hypothetical protein
MLKRYRAYHGVQKRSFIRTIDPVRVSEICLGNDDVSFITMPMNRSMPFSMLEISGHIPCPRRKEVKKRKISILESIQ